MLIYSCVQTGFLDADSIVAKDFVMVMIVDLAARFAGNQESFGKSPFNHRPHLHTESAENGGNLFRPSPCDFRFLRQFGAIG